MDTAFLRTLRSLDDDSRRRSIAGMAAVAGPLLGLVHVVLPRAHHQIRSHGHGPWLSAARRWFTAPSYQLKEIWGYPDPELATRSVDNAIARLRRKVEPDPHHPPFVRTVHGDGYCLTATDAVNERGSRLRDVRPRSSLRLRASPILSRSADHAAEADSAASVDFSPRAARA